MLKISPRKKLEFIALIFIFLCSLIFPLARDMTQAAGNIIYADIDGDGNLEQAQNNDSNSVNGYETFSDPDGSTTLILALNGNWDGKTDFFLDIDHDGLPEKYWDPSGTIISNVTITNVESGAKAILDDWVFSSQGNNINDRYYSPNFHVIRQQASSTDLSLTKIVSDPTPDPGDAITYTFTVANNGDYDVPGIQVANAKAPGQFIYQSSSSSQGTYDHDSGIWTIGTVAAGAQAVLTVTAQVPGSFCGNVVDPTATVSFTPTSTPIVLPKGESIGDTADASFLGDAAGDDTGFGNIGPGGDLNGDGYQDFSINISNENDASGKVDVIFGKPTVWQKDVTMADADNVTIYHDDRSDIFLGFDAPSPMDLNHDGLNDLVFSDLGPDGNGNVFPVWIVLGKTSAWPKSVDVASSTDFFNSSFYGAQGSINVGDVNHDGYDDLNILDTTDAYSHLLFGRNSGWPINGNLATSSDFSFEQAVGNSALRLGDVNGDEIDDFMIIDKYAVASSGKAYIFFGKTSGWQQNADSDASFIGEPQNGATEPSHLGGYISANENPLGDINGDGIDDIGLASYENSQVGAYSGKAYIILGKTSGWQNNQEIGTSSDASFVGEMANSKLQSIRNIGDVNGDGVDDLGLVASHNSQGFDRNGKIYVIFGKTSGWQNDQEIGTSSDASFLGVKDREKLRDVDAVGDFNADGYADFLVDSWGTDVTLKGDLYLMLGKPAGWTKNNSIASSAAASFVGEADEDQLQVSGASELFGDLNGDGYDDIVVGAGYNNDNGEHAGKVYIIFGKEDESWLIDSDYSDNSATTSVQIQCLTLAYAAGAHGTIIGSSTQMVNSGASGSAITASPNSGYRFVRWSDSSTSNPRIDTNIISDISVSASFEFIPTNSGNFSAPYCSNVSYGDWGNCANGMQYRDVLSQSPMFCALTTAQQATRSKVCGAASAIPITPAAPAAPAGNILSEIAAEAGIVSANNAPDLLADLGQTADAAKEQAGLIKYKIILNQDSKITATEKTAINNFIVYGTKSTRRLGAGERAGVINSYFQAYGRLPNSEAEWSDVIKIANGRWPSERSATSENQAKIEFKKIYGRNPVLANSYDQNAVMVIAYGLIPRQRNLASEVIAARIFRYYYGHTPVNALAWNVVRAIAYSGATR
ncbi:MAG: hypothetical protein PHE24_05445 [Patescibacteria group bacterium]|nr:hypothetical protein [Patescibacteria group bacterium]